MWFLNISSGTDLNLKLRQYRTERRNKIKQENISESQKMQIQQIPHIGSSQLPNPGPSSLGSVESPIRQESQDPCSSDLTRLRNCFIFEKSNFVILEMIAKSSRQHQSSLQ